MQRRNRAKTNNATAINRAENEIVHDEMDNDVARNDTIGQGPSPDKSNEIADEEIVRDEIDLGKDSIIEEGSDVGLNGTNDEEGSDVIVISERNDSLSDMTINFVIRPFN